jgi:uncharacterized membrane protein YGL010W
MTSSDVSLSQRDLNWWLTTYAKTHTHPVNTFIHYICVPVIFIVTIGLLNAIAIVEFEGFPPVTLAWLVGCAATIFYARLTLIAACVFVLCLVGLIAAGNTLFELYGASYVLALVSTFVLAWIGQFIGHKYEGAKPAFFDDVMFLLIGPLWVVIKLVRSLRGASV